MNSNGEYASHESVSTKTKAYSGKEVEIVSSNMNILPSFLWESILLTDHSYSHINKQI